MRHNAYDLDIVGDVLTATLIPASVLADSSEEVILSVVIPTFNEESSIEFLFARLMPVLDTLSVTCEVIVVDDGSRDETSSIVAACRAKDKRIKLVRFSRNFGKEAALSAGLEHASGRAIVQIDGDLQHPPEIIASFFEAWQDGYEIVYGTRRSRDDEPWLRRKFKMGFYRLFAAISEVELLKGAGDFILLDRKVADALLCLPERGRFTKGLYAWVGFHRKAIPFDVAPRDHGVSGWSPRHLRRFALDAITAFGSVPLKIWSYIGLLLAIPSFAYGAFLTIQTMIYGIETPGYASLMVALCFFSGVQLLGLGIIGEYLSRVLIEVKQRPLYLVTETIGFDPNPETKPTIKEKPLSRRRAS